MKLAIVILNWNGEHLLKQFLPSVVKYSEDAEIYVVDNASTDASAAFLKQTYPKITLVQHKENKGYAKGYNEALQHIEADIYCLLNSDVEVTVNWLVPVVSAFEKEPRIAVIQPKLLDFKRKEYFEYAGAAGGFIDKFGYPFCRGRLFTTLEEDNRQYNDTAEVFWASGACFFVRSAVFHQLHGFDEDYFSHQEEIDFCWRTQHLGYKVFYVGRSVVYHLGGATLANTNPRKTFLNFRNSLFSLVKNLHQLEAFSTVFMRLILDTIAGLLFLAQFKFRHFFAIVKAHFSFFYYLKKMLKKRNYPHPYKNYYYVKSIVWRYFILRKKHFGSLLK